MKILLILILALSLGGCGITGNLGRNYGSIHELGDAMDCGNFTVSSFKNYLRSSPRIYGSNTFVAYEDYGPGMSRGSTFIVLKDDYYDDTDIITLLKSSAPQKQSFWDEAIVLEGSIASNGFTVLIPEKSKTYGSSKIIDREELIIRSRIVENETGEYLMMVQTNDTKDSKKASLYLEEELDLFAKNLTWKKG